MFKCPACDVENPDENKFCKDCGYSFTGGGQTGQLNPDTVLENRYVIVKTIGRGGMGAVYMALDQRLNNRSVAIKEMSTRAVGGDLQAAIGAFKKEASMLIGLEHPALPVIRDFFSKGEDRWYLVMDYIEGQTLAEVVRNRGPIPETEVLDWARQLCEILGYLHSQEPPIIFRDLKPANIMLTPKGQIKLIDFGIARHFRVGSSADTTAYGSHGFAPPEQYGENQTSPSSDIYALGATLHYLLTGIDPGKNPFVFEPPSKTVKVSSALDNAIMKALELKAENRPKTMQEILALLPGSSAKSVNDKAGKKLRPFSNSKDLPSKINGESKGEASPSKSQSEAQTTPIIVVADIGNTPTNAMESQTVATDTNPPVRGTSGTSRKRTKTRNMILAACLVLVLLVGGVYGANYCKDNKANSGKVDIAGEETNQTGINPIRSHEDKTVANKEDADVSVSKELSQKQVEDTNTKIVFNDVALEKAIREQISKPQGDIYVSDVKDIERLELSGKGISNISALKSFRNLQVLNLSYNKIANISSLNGLTNLYCLNLDGNMIRDINPLGCLINLDILYLNENQISDINALKCLKNLSELHLCINQISDVSPLRSLTTIRILDLRQNKISDISALSGLTNCTLELTGNPISNKGPKGQGY